MNKLPNLGLAIILTAILALGTLQGTRVGHYHESKLFYDWVISAATQSRIFGNLVPPTLDLDGPGFQDDQLFASVVDVTEPLIDDALLPEEPADDDFNEDGKLNPKVVRLVDHGNHQELLWKLAISDDLAQQRNDFLAFRRDKKLASLGTQLDTSTLYSEGAANVSLGNIFFGFRKVAANFVWLEVDKYWHQGMMHRMVPLMKACVTLDPAFIDAYLIGAWHLAYNATANMRETPEGLKRYNPRYQARVGPKEAFYYMGIEFLQDGIRKNPRNYKLYFDLGFAIYELKLRDHANAARYLSEAIKLQHDRWVPRQLYIVMQRNEQYEEAIEGWKDYLKKFPDNLVAGRFIETNSALIHERDAEYALRSARAADALARLLLESGDDAGARAAEERAKQHRAEAAEEGEAARVVYEAIVAASPEGDSYSEGRLLHMEAVEFRDQGRYYEAVALLDQARWVNSQMFFEASDLMIKCKQEAGMQLQLTEMQYVVRLEKDAEYATERPQRLHGDLYRYREDDRAWVQAGYADEQTTSVKGGAVEYWALLEENPRLEEVLELPRGDVILKAGDGWYRCSPLPSTLDVG
jgi:hypothetical protein